MRRAADLHLVLLLSASACGGAAPPPAQVAARPVTHGTWARQDFVARHDVMTFTVLPTMARRFAEHTGEATPSMTCATCHGENALDVHYRMPSGLPPLPPAAMTTPDHGDPTIRFMQQVVTPTMAQLIDADGFTCFGCHPHE